MISIQKIIKFQARNRLIFSGFLSIFIHIIIFSLINKSIQVNTKGDKFIPIEVLINDSEAGSGESLKKQVKKNLKPIENSNKKKENNYDKEVTREADSKSMVKQEIKKSKSNKQTNKNLQDSKIKQSEKLKNSNNQIKMGSKKNINENNIPEKGSVKGKGKITITCLDCKSPKYPPKALRRGAEGSTLVKLWINTKGNVIKSAIIRSSGVESIDKAAFQAASKSKFYPIESDSTFNIEYDLTIK